MQQRGAACLGIAGKYFNWYVGTGQLLKEERPGRIVNVDQLIDLAHPRIVARALSVAYRAVRRQNVARYLLARLNREGRGTRLEIHPLNQSQVDRPAHLFIQDTAYATFTDLRAH